MRMPLYATRLHHPGMSTTATPKKGVASDGDARAAEAKAMATRGATGGVARDGAGAGQPQRHEYGRTWAGITGIKNVI